MPSHGHVLRTADASGTIRIRCGGGKVVLLLPKREQGETIKDGQDAVDSASAAGE